MNTFKVAVSAIIFNTQGQVLLGKRSQHEDVFPGLWGIPGGKVEAEDTEAIIEETLKREAKEEMGIEIQPERYLESACRIRGDEAKIYMIFTASHVAGTPQALEDTEEVRWWNLDDLQTNELTPHTHRNIIAASKLR